MSSREKRIVTRVAQKLMAQESMLADMRVSRQQLTKFWIYCPPGMRAHYRARAEKLTEEVMRLHAA